MGAQYVLVSSCLPAKATLHRGEPIEPIEPMLSRGLCSLPKIQRSRVSTPWAAFRDAFSLRLPAYGLYIVHTYAPDCAAAKLLAYGLSVDRRHNRIEKPRPKIHQRLVISCLMYSVCEKHDN